VSAHLHGLESPDWEILSLARNYAAAGPVVQLAEERLERAGRPWLARDLRPAAPAERPACLRAARAHRQPGGCGPLG
jgi:hypothetical protein